MGGSSAGRLRTRCDTRDVRSDPRPAGAPDGSRRDLAADRNLETSEVFQYEADTPQEIHRGEGWRLDQVFVSEASPDDPPPDPRKYGGRRRLSKLEFIDLLTDTEYVTILAAAKESVQIEAWIRKMELATPEDDGTSINLDDPRTDRRRPRRGNPQWLTGI